MDTELEHWETIDETKDGWGDTRRPIISSEVINWVTYINRWPDPIVNKLKIARLYH